MLSFFHQVLHTTFQEHTFLMNGLIQGVKVGHFPDNYSVMLQLKKKGKVLFYCEKNIYFFFSSDSRTNSNNASLCFQGLLSFLSAPLIGALSDVWGRKSFLLVTVFFTCIPIPLLRFNPW